MKKLTIGTGLCVLLTMSHAFAASTDSASASYLPKGGFFAGFGGSNNSVTLDRDLYAAGISDVYQSGVKVAYGVAGGPAVPYHASVSNLAPLMEVGYFNHFNNPNYIWGAKFSYQYLHATFSEDASNITQYGAFIPTAQAPSATTFSGHVAIAGMQTTLNQEISFMPFIGRAFNNSYVYFGAGPELLQVNSNLYNGIGFGDVNGVHTDITGSAVSFSHNNWVWATGAEIGVNYFFDPTWSVDLNYHYAISQKYSVYDSGPFESTTGNYNYVGYLYVRNTQQITSQAVMLTMNKML